VLPSGTLELVINLRDDEIRIRDRAKPERWNRHAGAVVSGAYGSFFEIESRVHAAMIGVHFKPGRAAPFFRVSPRELADAHVDLRELWGPDASDLRDRLRHASSLDQRFALLEAALRARCTFATRAEIGEGISALERCETVRTAAHRAGLGSRRFLDLFTTEVGMAPKRFERVVRFQRAAAMSQARTDWSRIAIEAGYFDQSHLIRDFVEFSGFSPEAFVRRRARVKEAHLRADSSADSSNTQRPATSIVRG
jgi:AraC-like DNA-binding protein